MEVKNKWYIKAFSFILIAAAFYFLYASASKSYEQLKEFKFVDVNFLLLFLSVPFFIAAVAFSGYSWMKLFKKKLKKGNTIYMYMYIWGLKYIPGQIGTSLGKIEWGLNHEIKKKSTLAKILEEHIYIVLSSIFLSFPLIFLLRYIDYEITIPYWVLLAISFVFILSIYAVNKHFNILTYVDKNNVVIHLFNFSISRLLNGIGLIFVYLAVHKGIDANILLVPSIFILSSLIGLLSFFVPGGLGVREASMIFLLGHLVSPTEAILISIFSRIMNIVSDLITWLIGLVKYEK